jgi:hypothetical protein
MTASKTKWGRHGMMGWEAWNDGTGGMEWWDGHKREVMLDVLLGGEKTLWTICVINFFFSILFQVGTSI